MPATTRRRTRPRRLVGATALGVAGVLLAITGCTAANAPAAVATDTRAVTHDENDRVPEGASWTQHYFPSSDDSDVELHADVLLPEGLDEGEQVPVILSVGPYFGHSGETSVEDWEHTGPSNRFDDLVEGGKLLERGYALVLVDSRGFGGSTGCLDFVGPGEQADIAAAVEWSAEQPWSTGDVGMYGKSYDAITGLAANNLDLDPLKAVVAQEPIWDLQRNIWSNGIPRTTIVNVAGEYNKIATLDQMPDDDDRYRENAAYEKEKPECVVVNQFSYEIADPASEYWTVRDLAAGAAGSDTPLFLTQGTLEWNTEAEAVETFLAGHEGPTRGWIGPWDHQRGNDRTKDGQLTMGREGWFDEVMAFFDTYVKGAAVKGADPEVEYPAFSVQDNTGEWRALESWPAAESSVDIALPGGSYVDDGGDAPAVPAPGRNFNVRSEPVAQPVRVVGTPRMSIDVAAGRGNVAARLYDVAPDGSTVMFDEQVSLVRPGRVDLELKTTEWTLAEGHSLAVEIGAITPFAFSDWLDSPSLERIDVSGARLTLALDDPADDVPTDGDPAVFLEQYAAAHALPIPEGPVAFALPAPGDAGGRP